MMHGQKNIKLNGLFFQNVLFLLLSIRTVIDNYINVSEILQQSAALLICVGGG